VDFALFPTRLASICFALLVLAMACLRGAEIHDAAAKGELEKVRGLLAAHPEMKDLRDSSGGTPLHEAARHGYLDVVKLLVAMKADMFALDRSNMTPLKLAIGYGHEKVALFLQSNGAGGSPDVKQRPPVKGGFWNPVVRIYGRLVESRTDAINLSGGDWALVQSTNMSGKNGSGFIVTADGYIVSLDQVVLTDNHKPFPILAVRIDPDTAKAKQFDATLVDLDASTHLAVLKITNPDPLPYLRLGAATNLGIGHPISIQGYAREGTLKVTDSRVLALLRPPAGGGSPLARWLECLGLFEPGIGGAPVLALSGEVVGVAVAKAELKLPQGEAQRSVQQALMEGFVQGIDKERIKVEQQGDAAALKRFDEKARKLMETLGPFNSALVEAAKNPNRLYAVPVAEVRNLLKRCKVALDE
jgi:S1-C subfamily serine protease